MLATAALVDAPGAARFASEQGWLEQTWPLVNAASQLAPLDLPAALELIRALPMEPTQRAGYCWDLLRAAAEDDLEGALAELPTTMAWAGPESGVPGPMLRTLAQARLKRGYGLLPCMGLDLPLALPDVPLNAGARCSALSALAAAMREWYPEQAALAAAEAQRAALSLVQQEGNVWLASWVAPDLALASPEAVWRLMEAVPETSPEGQSSFRLAALLRIGETLTGELGWSGPYWEY